MIAMASRAKASRFQTFEAIWWAAISASPIRAATAVPRMSTTRRLSVRIIRLNPALADARTPRASGRSGAPCRRAPRATAPAYRIAPPVCASTVAQADPAMPQPSTSTKTAPSAALTANMPTDT